MVELIQTRKEAPLVRKTRLTYKRREDNLRIFMKEEEWKMELSLNQ